MNHLQLKHPLIVAPMAGGPSTVDLVVASCEAGALGSIGAAYLSGTAITEFVQNVRARTQRPFAVNLFIPSKLAEVSADALNRAIAVTKKFREELQLSTPVLKAPYEEDFDRQFETVLEIRPAILSFVFGLLGPDYIRETRKQGIYLVGTATTTEEALELEASGVDAIVVQGVEAGGHRGIFNANAEDPNVSTLTLVKDVKPRTKIPIIAAGGLMNASDIRLVLKSGADLVQLGTAFLATQEAGTSAPYRRELLRSSHRPTKLSRAFSGRLARGIVNRFMSEVDAHPADILPFPAQNRFTRELRQASLAADSSDLMSLWSGTGEGALWTGSTADLIHELFAE